MATVLSPYPHHLIAGYRRQPQTSPETHHSIHSLSSHHLTKRGSGQTVDLIPLWPLLWIDSIRCRPSQWPTGISLPNYTHRPRPPVPQSANSSTAYTAHLA